MKTKISEDTMIVEFLQSEMDSYRFREKIDVALEKHHYTETIITNPDTTNLEENKMRKMIFNHYRGYADKKKLFENFPDDVEWFEEKISKETLLNNVYYIDFDYWDKLSNGTRLPKNAVTNITNNVEIFNESNDIFKLTSEEFRKGQKFKKLILVSDGKKLVVLEGHLRITVYAMNPDLVPAELPVIIGYSKDIENWDCF